MGELTLGWWALVCWALIAAWALLSIWFWWSYTRERRREPLNLEERLKRLRRQ